ncbi:VOC family protein [Euryhalocaulis caribicus]|uniref:VOC family protein n=1 Tax=Euryhalocaulis caribicus TaxID=1161401 RepID=UPI0003AAE397|nr:VOC family protein [Euryhalocaulis caribicus]
MTVKRIVANVEVANPQDAKAFYEDLFGLDVVMDHGWLITLASGETMKTQVSFASQGGSDTEVPALSIEVDDVDAVHARAKKAGHQIVYDIVDEPWGVRRFYVRDPFGQTLNVLSHKA